MSINSHEYDNACRFEGSTCDALKAAYHLVVEANMNCANADKRLIVPYLSTTDQGPLVHDWDRNHRRRLFQQTSAMTSGANFVGAPWLQQMSQRSWQEITLTIQQRKVSDEPSLKPVDAITSQVINDPVAGVLLSSASPQDHAVESRKLMIRAGRRLQHAATHWLSSTAKARALNGLMGWQHRNVFLYFMGGCSLAPELSIMKHLRQVLVDHIQVGCRLSYLRDMICACVVTCTPPMASHVAIQAT